MPQGIQRALQRRSETRNETYETRKTIGLSEGLPERAEEKEEELISISYSLLAIVSLIATQLVHPTFRVIK
jgi:hypothetical protein